MWVWSEPICESEVWGVGGVKGVGSGTWGGAFRGWGARGRFNWRGCEEGGLLIEGVWLGVNGRCGCVTFDVLYLVRGGNRGGNFYPFLFDKFQCFFNVVQVFCIMYYTF
jgi:hypothetical protein